MGKKSDKSAKEKPIVQNSEEILNKTPEPYQCIGNLVTDFTELYREQNLGSQIPIVVQNKRGLSPTGFLIDTNINTQAVKKGAKDDKKPQSVTHQSDPDMISPEDKEIVNAIGFKPRSFVIKPTFSALKPSIFIETENIDKPDTVTEIGIRRWRVDIPILDILGTCFSYITKLTTITLWRVGLTSDAITRLADVLDKCETVKNLTIENNEEATEENYHELIKFKSNLLKLHLRYCNVTPKGAKLIAEELGTLSNPGNSKLLVLDLSGCPLGDFGAVSLAKGLRINKSLLSLSVNNCDIGDEGAIEIAKTVSRYILSDEEILCRRQLISERNVAASQSISCYSRGSMSSTNVSPPISRRGDSKDRPVSVRSSSKDDKSKKEKVATTKGKKEVKEDKHEKTLTKGKKEEKNTTNKKVPVVANDVSKTPKSRGGRSAKQNKLSNQAETMSETNSENLDNVHPLLNKVEAIEPGKLLIGGNFLLLMLNMSRNRISERGLEEFNMAISYQTTQLSMGRVHGTGLMRLSLQSNQFEESNDAYQKIQLLLNGRDRKSKSPNLDFD